MLKQLTLTLICLCKAKFSSNGKKKKKKKKTIIEKLRVQTGRKNQNERQSFSPQFTNRNVEGQHEKRLVRRLTFKRKMGQDWPFFHHAEFPLKQLPRKWCSGFLPRQQLCQYLNYMLSFGYAWWSPDINHLKSPILVTLKSRSVTVKVKTWLSSVPCNVRQIKQTEKTPVLWFLPRQQ